MNTNYNDKEELIPMNSSPEKKKNIFIRGMDFVIDKIQTKVLNVYREEKNPYYLACRNTFVFLRKYQIDHIFEKDNKFNDFIYSILFYITYTMIVFKGFFTTLKLADKAEFYLDNYKEINEGFVIGTAHKKKDHIKY